MKKKFKFGQKKSPLNMDTAEVEIKVLSDMMDKMAYPVPTLSFGSCKTSTPVMISSDQQEGNNPMYANVANAAITVPPTEVQDQRKYLENRLEKLFWKKDEPLYSQFG